MASVPTKSSPSAYQARPELVISPSFAHPILFSKLKNANISSEDFVYYAKRAMRLVAIDAMGELNSNNTDLLCAVSIIRSDDALLDCSVNNGTILPGIKVGTIALPDSVNVLPTNIQDMNIVLCDPLCGSGESAIDALNVLIVEHGVDPKRIVFANMILSWDGCLAIAKAFPDVKIVTANLVIPLLV